jgi:hypothetical protein
MKHIPSILLLTLLFGGMAILTLKARNGETMPAYGTFLNSLFPPKALQYPLTQQTLRSPDKKITLNVSHKFPSSYSFYLFIPPEQTNHASFPEIGPVRIRILQNGEEIHNQTCVGRPVAKNGRIGRAFCTYMSPKHTGTKNTVQIQAEFLGDISPLFQKNRNIIASVESAP